MIHMKTLKYLCSFPPSNEKGNEMKEILNFVYCLTFADVLIAIYGVKDQFYLSTFVIENIFHDGVDVNLQFSLYIYITSKTI